MTTQDGTAFIENAARIFETAQCALATGDPVQDVSILIGDDGGVRLCMSHSDWSLDSLRDHHGARVAYRVSRTDRCVRVEGRAGSRTCLFEAAKPDGAARLLLANAPRYMPEAANGPAIARRSPFEFAYLCRE